MASPLDPTEVEALMQAIQEGQVPPDSGVDEANGPVVPYDLTSQDRIIRGQMPTLDSINDRIASLFGRTLSGRTRMELRVTAAPASLMKFADINSLLTGQNAVGVMSLGAGHGLALVIVEAALAHSLLVASLGDRKAKSEPGEARLDLTHVGRCASECAEHAVRGHGHLVGGRAVVQAAGSAFRVRPAYGRHCHPQRRGHSVCL